jgi:hypothetical protein
MYKSVALLSSRIILGLGISVAASAADGVILINQAVVTAAGGFPYTISQPGSYKLTGGLIAPANAAAIVIAASNVQLDMNGFTVTCNGAQNPGITSPATTAGAAIIGLKIRNGSITGCSTAVDVSNAQSAEIVSIQASNYMTGGILISNGAVRNCVTYGATPATPGSFGIAFNSFQLIVEDNLVSGDAFGISGVGLAKVSGNVVNASNVGLFLRTNGKAVSLVGGNAIVAQSAAFQGLSQGNNSCNGESC